MKGAVAELVDAGDSKSPDNILESSSLSSPTMTGDNIMEYLIKENVLYRNNNFLKEKISEDHFIINKKKNMQAVIYC